MHRTPSASNTPQSKVPKPRNTEARKEQNRIASRAYSESLHRWLGMNFHVELTTFPGEKRRHKLALLDHILNTDDGESPSSHSEADDAHGVLSVAHSRDTSISPMPTPQLLATASTASTWPASDHMSAETENFGGGTFDDLWMNDFDRSNNIFATDSEFVTGYHTSSTTPFAPNLSLPTSIPVDQILGTVHTNSYPDPARSTSGTGQETPLIYDDPALNSDMHGSAMTAALDSFSRLNPAQQQQLLDIIHKQRNMSTVMGSNQTWNTQVDYPATPPAGKTRDILRTIHMFEADGICRPVPWLRCLSAAW